MRKIAFYYNDKHKSAVVLFEQISDWLEKIGKEPIDYLKNNGAEADLLVSIGGDGTLLKSASFVKDKNIPILGVNAGSLGFLTSSKADELRDTLLMIFEGRYTLEERLMLRVFVESKKVENVIADVLNDVVITREGVSRFIGLSVEIDGVSLMEFGGDGVIVATPTGSSAYSLSAGGPLLYPTLEGMLITPLCPHSLKTRPVIVGASQRIKISLSGRKREHYASVIFDGQHKIRLEEGESVIVKRAPFNISLVHCVKRSFYDIIKEKL